MHHSGKFGATTGTDVDYSTHRGAGTRNAAEQTGNRIADPLPYQFSVGVVPTSSHIVGDKRRQQAVDRAQNRQDECGFEHERKRRTRELGYDESREPGRDVAENWCSGDDETE